MNTTYSYQISSMSLRAFQSMEAKQLGFFSFQLRPSKIKNRPSKGLLLLFESFQERSKIFLEKEMGIRFYTMPSPHEIEFWYVRLDGDYYNFSCCSLENPQEDLQEDNPFAVKKFSIMTRPIPPENPYITMVRHQDFSHFLLLDSEEEKTLFLYRQSNFCCLCQKICPKVFTIHISNGKSDVNNNEGQGQGQDISVGFCKKCLLNFISNDS